MEKAKQTIRDFTSKSGHHDTTVHSATAPAVEHETVKPQHHENVNTAIDREVHQDHYHQTVQPVQAQEVLPEQHHHKLGAVEHREFDHRDNEETRRRLAAETEGFHDERVVHDATRTKVHAPVVEGEHVHHHLHETIQPVVHKETIEPHVVHTTVPVHETHHNKAQHHQTTTLPTVSMSDWKQKGGLLHGKDERYDNFEGQPEDVGGVHKALHHSHHSDKEPLEGHTFHGDFNEEGGKEGHRAHHTATKAGPLSSTKGTTTGTTTGTTAGLTSGTTGITGNTGNTGTTGRTSMIDEASSNTSRGSGVAGTTGGGAAASAAAMAMKSGHNTSTAGTTGNTVGSDVGNTTTRHTRADSGKGFTDDSDVYDKRKPGAFETARVGEHGRAEKVSSHDETKKPGLLDRLNPMTDSNGDGQAGFMK
ncbi:hypothetical protein PG997_003054 [Apiospora hydei]|uniref:Allergen n=1 Tax=Apiospora hydei TaxID=1337664 RepID=A0ABR1WY48_9PEZI